KVIADWIVDGQAPFALVEADPRRTMSFQTNRRYLERRVTETLDLSYGIHWPYEQRESARGIRRSPLHDMVAGAGAVFGEVAGWERANWYARDGISARYEYSFGRPNWFGCATAEHEAVRTGVGIFDISSFGKLQVEGPQALALLQRVSANDIDVAPGRIVYTQWLNDRGGIEADVTVTRLRHDQFLVLTAASSTVRDADWLRRRTASEEVAIVTDVTSGLAMLSVMGPRSRDLLSELTDADLSDAAFPFGTSREVDFALAEVRATRITYVGELGWELLVPTEMAVHVYEAIVEAGRGHGLVHAGYHALNSLRMEKSYRSWGHDIGPDDTPLEAGLSFAVAWDKPAFIGRDALVAQRESGVRRRLVQLLVPDPEAFLYHDEPVLRDGVIVGKVASAMYGPTLGGTVALAYVGGDHSIDTAWINDGRYEVDVAGTRFPATASLRAMYDPTSERTKG
ncbi:MAG: glycine cleavage T C-terminal barrel domain-containing protein, partial [Candidatus Nanopelagicales bacterium]